jgi:ubiquinone/menaquinone biosynthesis C-methylase UbiE
LLDVACGSGNLAIAAARFGVNVTGVDIAANSLEEALASSESEGLTVRFDEGGAENLPYADAAFAEVVSMFGAIFAPRPELAAA